MFLDKLDLPNPLYSFSKGKQLTFALLIVERMIPSLVRFSRETGFDVSSCIEARDFVWKLLQSHKGSIGNESSYRDDCLENAPDTETYSHELTSIALNAVLTCDEMLQFIRDGLAEHLTQISTFAEDSIYLYLSRDFFLAISSTEENLAIASHPLMLQELHRQIQDIEFLNTLPNLFNDEIVMALKIRASTQPSLLSLAA